MDMFLVTAAASFLGTTASLLFVIWLKGSIVGAIDETAVRPSVPPRTKIVRLTATALFAAFALLILQAISTGNLAAGLGAIAVVLAFMVLAYAARVLR